MAIDKQELYGRFQKHLERNRRFQRMVAAKGMDLPWDEEDVNIQANRGIGGWPLLGMVTIIVAGLLGWKWLVSSPPPVPPLIPAKAQEFRVTFSAENGTEIEVDRGDSPPQEAGQ